MFRLGDFYEMFGEDAKLASKILDIVLTARNREKDFQIPMCGVPYHAVDSYIAKLVKAGQKVAICDQMEDPAAAKGIVKRAVTRIITPGTFDDSNYLSSAKNNFTAVIYEQGDKIGLSWCDVTTGELWVTEIDGLGDTTWDTLRSELARIQPSEIVLQGSLFEREEPVRLLRFLSEEGFQNRYAFGDWAFVADNALGEVKKQYQVLGVEGLGLGEYIVGTTALGALLSYLEETQKQSLKHLRRPQVRRTHEGMYLDSASIRSLEIVESLHEGQLKASLLSVFEPFVVTPMGKRGLRQWLLRPLANLEAINQRLDAVALLGQQQALRDKVGEALLELADLERLAARLALGRIMPREILKLQDSLQAIPKLQAILALAKVEGLLGTLQHELQFLPELVDLVGKTIAAEPAAVIAKGGVIRDGFHSELDELRAIKGSGKNWIRELEVREKTRTGIGSLKVGYNKVFGYFLEVTNSNLAQVPTEWMRKQTLVNAERYITDELKTYEAKVLGAEERIVELETALYEDLVGKLLPHIPAIQQNAKAVASLDILSGFAQLAREQYYVRPQMVEETILDIREGRHPVVEKLVEGERFIPNDTRLANSLEQVIVLTGPNMAGKSTYLRQVALISLLAQVGSFVPAKAARLGVIDRIFTRIGAADNLTRGQSTFMVEMQETANILNNATEHSLVILDEIGRGTSTYDGLSIAWAVVEFLHGAKDRGPMTLFATHYHELTQLEQELPRVKNFNIAVRESGGKVIFLRKIIRGGVDQSYGIQVAQLAGLPREVISRAHTILAKIEEQSSGLEQKIADGRAATAQMTFIGAAETVGVEKSNAALDDLREMKIESMTPLDALVKLAELKKMSEGE